MNTDILIVGAGPVGLNLAVCLSNLGINYRIIDKKPGPNQTSNAIGVNPRTLEIWQTLGFVDEAINRGIKLNHASWYDHNKLLNKVSFAHMNSIYKFMLALPQSQTENLLNEQLTKHNIAVEWNTTLSSFVETNSTINSTCITNNIEQIIVSKWIIGCDGYKSSVRELAKIERTCHDLTQHFIMIDATLNGNLKSDEMTVGFSDEGALFFFPMQNGTRVVAEISNDKQFKNSKVGNKDVFDQILNQRFSGLSVAQVDWGSAFYVHECLAQHYYTGHVILCGDAAHTHSPAGGQGMNSGIQDTWNLAWKLVHIIHNQASDTILETYHDERHEVGSNVLKLSGKITAIGTTRNKIMQILRNFMISHIFHLKKISSKFVNSIGQTDICYTNSTLVNTKQVLQHKKVRYQLNKIEWRLLSQEKDVYNELPKFVKVEKLINSNIINTQFCLIRPDGYVSLYANTINEIKDFFSNNKFIW